VTVNPERFASTLEPLFDRAPLPEQLEQIAAAALDDVPGVDGYAICLLDAGEVTVRASRGDFVPHLHRVQHELHDGSCWATTMGEDRYVALEDVRAGSGPRPTYTDAAADCGVRAQASVRIRPRRRTIGALTVFSQSQPLTPVGLDVLDAVGRVVALAVEQAKVREGVEDGLRGRTVIGQALGIIMERHRMGEDAALQYLKRRSSVENRKIRDLAAEIAGGGPTI
jgi:hypothetical protein